MTHVDSVSTKVSFPTQSELNDHIKSDHATEGPPLTVVVTGAAGNIAYSIIFMIGNGDLAGSRPINLVLLDIPPMAEALKGVEMEIVDCAFPCVAGIKCTTDYQEAFTGADVAFLIGARPRGPGMERSDLLKLNAAIFMGQGTAIDKYANKTIKVLVVGNPANTNALITMTNAPSISRRNFSAMTRLDQNRAESQIALKCGGRIKDVQKVCIWGNHSAKMFADLSNGTVKGEPVSSKTDAAWVEGELLPTIQKRGAAIITARGGKSSAASAAKAAVDHVREWMFGTPPGKWSSMGVVSDGNGYGVPDDLIFSFPCICANGEWKMVEGLSQDDNAKKQIKENIDELLDEKKMAFAQ